MRGKAAAALAVAALVAGCGGDSERVATSPTPTAPPVEAPTTSTVQTTQKTTTTELGGSTERTTTSTPPMPTAPATTPSSGAGDEEAARSPVLYLIDKGVVKPTDVKVPAYLSIEFMGFSQDGAEHTLGLSAGAEYTIVIPAGGRASKTVPGLRPGKYRVILDGRQTSVYLRVGGDAGP